MRVDVARAETDEANAPVSASHRCEIEQWDPRVIEPSIRSCFRANAENHRSLPW